MVRLPIHTKMQLEYIIHCVYVCRGYLVGEILYTHDNLIRCIYYNQTDMERVPRTDQQSCSRYYFFLHFVRSSAFNMSQPPPAFHSKERLENQLAQLFIRHSRSFGAGLQKIAVVALLVNVIM